MKRPNFFLTTDRIGFSTWELDDVDIATELWGNAIETEYTGGLLTKGAIFRKLATERKVLKLYNVQSWPVFLSKTSTFIGYCGLRPHNLGDRTYDLETHIKQKYRRKRYGTEAAMAIINYAFGALEAKAVYASLNPRDDIGGKFLASLGFEYSHDEYSSITNLQHRIYLLKK